MFKSRPNHSAAGARRCAAATTGICIGLVKDTAILSVISVVELAFQTKQAVSRTYAPFETYFVVALIYWCMLSTFEVAMRWLERRITRYRVM